LFQLTPALWIGAGLVLAALEMVIPGLVILWFGVAAVITGVLAMFVKNNYLQFGVFVVLSTVMVVFSQRIARRLTKPEPEQVGANRMTGAVGRVVVALEPGGYGRVKVRGEEWLASSASPIAVGRDVKVVTVDGTHVVVEPVNEGSH
jgi:membrane protein implicated in regulation of membrane protease activity